MSTVERVCELLKEKQARFLAYEKVTEALAESDVDTAEHYITQRSELANEIDLLTEQIGRLCDKDVNGVVLLKAAGAQCDYQEVPPEFRQVFECGQEVRTVAYRIGECEKRARQHLVVMRDEAMGKIRENQNLPKIKKYLTDLTEKSDGQGFGQRKI